MTILPGWQRVKSRPTLRNRCHFDKRAALAPYVVRRNRLATVTRRFAQARRNPRDAREKKWRQAIASKKTGETQRARKAVEDYLA